MKAGLTQVEIGEAADMAQSSISDLYRGVTKDVSWQAGSRINALHEAHVSQESKVSES